MGAGDIEVGGNEKHRPWYSTGFPVRFTVPVPDAAGYRSRHPLRGMGRVLRRPVIWAHAAVIVCAYCAYKGLDNYSLYAVQVLGMDEVRGAALATYGAWIRPFAAVLAGVVADRFNAARAIGVSFAVLSVSWVLLALSSADAASMNLVHLNLFVTFFAVFALRGIYFALSFPKCSGKINLSVFRFMDISIREGVCCKFYRPWLN